MRPTTIRRLLVFSVCLVGVGCLYLVPSRAGAPSRTGSSAARSDVLTAATPAPALVTAISAEPTSSAPTAAPNTAITLTPRRPAADQHSAGGRTDEDTRPRSAATAVASGRDAGEPPKVGRLTVVSADPDRLVISWPGVDDNDLVGYRVWVNGFSVATVLQTRARLVWFNDSDTHVIQVRALDATGQEGPSSPTLLVTRPSPSPAPTPPSVSPSTAPTTRKPSTAPPGHDDNADAPLDQTIATPTPTEVEAGGTQEEHS